MTSLSPLTALEVVLLAVAAWPGLRLMRLRKLARLFPWHYAAIAVAILVWLGAVVWLAAVAPSVLHVLATLVVLGSGAALLRARPNFGRRHRWPPGSLSLGSSIEAIVERDFYRRQAARHGAVFKMAQFHRPVACVVGLERGQRLLHEHEDALGASTQRLTRDVPRGFLRYMDDDTHGRYGPLFRQALSAQVVGDAEPVIREAIERELARAADEAAGTSGRTLDPTRCLASIVDAAFFRTLFGVTPGTPAFAAVAEASRPLVPLALSDSLTPAATAGLEELRRLLVTPVPNRSRSALTELHRLDADQPDATAVDNLVFIWKISSSNITGLLRWLLAWLGRHPEWIERLRADLAAPEPTDLPDRIIMETLRLSQSEYLYRRMARDIVFDGFRLPKNWLVRVCVRESHGSAESFDEPDRFNPDRFLARDYPRTAYSPFGFGRHACNGVALTYAVGRAFLEELTRRYDWSVTGHDRHERDFRHWSHWRPGRRMTLSLVSARASATDRAR